MVFNHKNFIERWLLLAPIPFAMDRDTAGRRQPHDTDEVVSPITGANLNPISPVSRASDDTALDVTSEGYHDQYQDSEALGQTHLPQAHQAQLHQSPSSHSDNSAHEPHSTATHEESEAFLDQPQPDVQQAHPSRDHQDDPPLGPRWRPCWLTPGPLGALALLFLSSAIALISMLAYSEAHDGLSDANDSLVYLWRFGPTACESLI
jgi:hypothetical protein